MKELKIIAGALLDGSKKRRKISREFKRAGMMPLKAGAWLACRSHDIISGLIVEGSPSDTYISSFIQPTFDKITFFNWSLGRRVIHCSSDQNAKNECEEAFAYYCKNLASVKSSEDLLMYLDRENLDGFYPVWVRYLCYLNRGDLKQAEEYLTEEKIDDMHSATVDKLEEIKMFVDDGDISGVKEVMKRWRDASDRFIGYCDEEFSAFRDC